MQQTGQTKPRPKAVEPPPEFQAGKIMSMDSPQLVGILKDPAATEFQRMKACQRLAVVGTKDAVPALVALLGDPKLAPYARFGLVPIPDPSVDDALREAAKKLKGHLLVGVIDSIGNRQDVKSIPLLTRLFYGADTEVARAAAASLGLISGPSATKVLQDALLKAKGVVRTAAAEACMVSAEGLMARGDRNGALALYAVLSRPDIPKPVRLAAMHSTIAAETSLTHPRPAAPAKQ
jgi:HEAT repeat protein